jgi:transcriptional regulator with XRE-family HTH domain
MAPTTYSDVLARNIKAHRGRANLSQDLVAARMKALGYTAWLRQTVTNVEKGRRRVTAEEVLGLAAVLETSVASLMKPTDDDVVVEFPSGAAIAVASVRRSVDGQNDRSVRWDGAIPEIDSEPELTQLVAEGAAARTRVSRSGEVRTQDPATGDWIKREED